MSFDFSYLKIKGKQANPKEARHQLWMIFSGRKVRRKQNPASWTTYLQEALH